MVDLLVRVNKFSNRDEIVRNIIEREKLGSTGVGDHIAIPHGKIPGLNGFYAAFGRSKQGIDFEAIDHQPVKFFFLIIGPQDKPADHIKLLAKLARIFRSERIKNLLENAEDAKELYQILIDSDEANSALK